MAILKIEMKKIKATTQFFMKNSQKNVREKAEVYIKTPAFSLRKHTIYKIRICYTLNIFLQF